MIRLSGLEPGRDVEIQYVGLRPGEKLYEELLIDGEEVVTTEHPRVRLVRTVDPGVPVGWLESLTRATESRDVRGVIAALCDAVPEYLPSDLVLRPATSILRRPE